MLREFRPSLLFLGKFLGIYLLANIAYGVWISSLQNHADSITKGVTYQTSSVLNACGENTQVEANPFGPTVKLEKDGKAILNVFEGCNGINVMIVFVAFIVAFGGSFKRMAWFVPVGLLTIHVFNIIRIVLLYTVAQHFQRYFYYVHKYVFTAALYVIVLALWLIWVKKVNQSRHKVVND